ncbi:MAG: glycosyltransferase family 4 protein [Pseudomonadota bacterium]
MYKIPKWRFYDPQNTRLDCGFEKDEIRYIRPPGTKFLLWEDYFIYWSLRKRALMWHEKKRFDAVLGVSMLPDAGAASMLGRYMNLPSVGLAIGSDVKVCPNISARLKNKLSNVIDDLDMIVGVSKDICNSIKAVGMPKREPETIYLGRDVSLFKPAEDKSDYRKRFNIPNDAVVGIYVGLIAKKKGMAELAAIIPSLVKKYPGFYLILVGDGPSLGTFELLGNQYRQIILPGNLPPDSVASYLKCSDFMIFPSYSEGMPQAVLEAMNCGLCVIASRVGGIPEAVIEGETGLLIEPENPQQLQTAIEKLLSNASMRQKLSARAESYSYEKFDPCKNAERFAKLLYSLIPGQK